MRAFGVVFHCVIIILGLSLVGCPNAETKKAAAETVENQNRQSRATEAIDVIEKLVFVKDPSSGLCFGYSWSGMANGGPVLVHVPCEAVKL